MAFQQQYKMYFYITSRNNANPAGKLLVQCPLGKTGGGHSGSLELTIKQTNMEFAGQFS